MWDFFNALGEFFNSEFAKSNRAVIILLISSSMIVTAVVISLIFNKIIIPFKVREVGDFESKYQKALEENERLKEQLKGCKNIKNMTDAIHWENSKMQEDKALSSFLKKQE